MAEGDASTGAVRKHATGLPGFEYIADGGLPAGRATLIAGSSGSGKTIFTAQFLVEGIRREGQPGVLVTFEEPPSAIRDNFESLGWPIREWEEQGLFAFVDLSPDEDQPEITGQFELGALLPRIEHAVNRVGAQRLVIDSVGTLYSEYSDGNMVRRALGQLMAAIRRMAITTLVTAERTAEYGPIARYGVEEFVADAVILLRHVLEGDKRRRTIEILKMRGTSHRKGEYPFTVSAESGGVNIIPLSAIELNQPADTRRASFGVAEMDAMCAGGVLRQSISLVAGPTGTGKSLIASHFLTGAPGERCLMVAFEEGRDQLARNAAGWNMAFADMQHTGNLRIHAVYPETATLEAHLVYLKHLIAEFKPDRLALDSLSALERISSDRSFRDFLVALVAYLRERRVTTLFTTNTTGAPGHGIAGEAQVSSMTDTIILLRYAEKAAQITRALVVLKMRGSDQDKTVREFEVTNNGLRIGEPLTGQNGSLLEFVQS